MAAIALVPTLDPLTCPTPGNHEYEDGGGGGGVWISPHEHKRLLALQVPTDLFLAERNYKLETVRPLPSTRTRF